MMTKTLITSMVASAICLSSCQNSSQNADSNDQDSTVQETVELVSNEIPYAVAERYFLKNTVEKIDNPKIETKEEFDRYFGPAPVMGQDGKPTEIDFSKQYVIAVALPETEFATKVEPVNLVHKDNGEIEFTYTIVLGEKNTFTTKPILLLVVDKAHEGNVVLKELS